VSAIEILCFRRGPMKTYKLLVTIISTGRCTHVVEIPSWPRDPQMATRLPPSGMGVETGELARESWHGRSRIRGRLRAVGRHLWLISAEIVLPASVDCHDFRVLERWC
jgi:hypothetical protein